VNNSNQLTVKSDVAGATFNSKVKLGTGYHAVEVCGTVGTSSLWDLYLDGTAIVNAWSASTGTTPVGRIMIGDPANKTVTANVDNVRLDQIPGDGIPRPTAPGKPFGSSPSIGEIQLSWAAASSPYPPITYRIYRDGNPVAIGESTTTSYQDPGLTPGSSHTYTVEAVDAFGTAGPISEASSSITVSAGAVPAIFADDFTSGTLASWTVSSNLTVDGTAGTPAPSARAQVSGLPAYAYATVPAQSGQVCMSMDVNLQTDVATVLMRLNTGSGSKIVKVQTNANRKLLIKSEVSGASNTTTAVLTSGWHSLELCGSIGTSTSWDLWLDGTQIVTGWATSTGLTPVGRIQIGDTVAKTITINYDHVRLDQVAGG
jgi:hypothetical protein